MSCCNNSDTERQERFSLFQTAVHNMTMKSYLELGSSEPFGRMANWRTLPCLELTSASRSFNRFHLRIPICTSQHCVGMTLTRSISLMPTYRIVTSVHPYSKEPASPVRTFKTLIFVTL